MTPALPPSSGGRFSFIAAVLAAATIAAVVFTARAGLRDREALSLSGERVPNTLLLTAAPQDGEVFLTWSPIPEATYRLGWRAAGESDWKIAHTTSSRRTVAGLPNGAAYQFQIEARQFDGTMATSRVVTATPRLRPGCSTLDYVPPPPRVNFFCTKAALDEYLTARGIDPLSLRCRQQALAAWTSDVPDCHYVTPDGEHLLLLRSADRMFAGGNGFPSTTVVREHARRAIWSRDDPFDEETGRTPALTPLDTSIIGKVTRHASARSFQLAASHGLVSTVTWFVPVQPVPGRFSIYHEGHGGAAVDIGADTIDWLLDRGWQVVAMDMPLLGGNRPAGRPGLQSHADLQALDDGTVSPIEHFLRPVKSVVEAILATEPGQDPDILLIGRSGGGWTTYVYAAVDPRIDFAVSVAGGRPISARLDAPWGAAELGDYEQSAPHLYDVTSHEHLMLAAGARGALYIFNRWDGCCYRVQPDDAFVRYLRRGAGPADKHIAVFVDRHHREHSMSPHAYEELDSFLTRVLQRRLP
ncbi:hypothetical protein BH24ACI5_BH24ACI5_07820 [soil metagenome]